MPPLLTRQSEDTLAISLSTCRGSEFQDSLTKVKEIPGRRFDPDTKLWLIPAEPSVAERVMYALQPQMADDLVEWIREARLTAQEELTTPLPEDSELLIPWATQRAPWQPEFIEVADTKIPFDGLKKHQRPVVELAAERRKLLVCDDMGGGKTGIALSAYNEALLRGHITDGPKLVICPNSVKGTWEDEIALWLDNESYQIIDAATPGKRHEQVAEAIAGNAYVIVNWEQVRVKREQLKIKRRDGSVTKKAIDVMKEPLFEFPSRTDVPFDEWTPELVRKIRRSELSKDGWKMVVADEVHRAKNRKALQTRGLWLCRAEEGLMLGLSGTPLMNTPAELWSILKWLWPEQYTSYWRFHDDYCETIEGYFGKVLVGVKNPDALRFELKDRVVRRTQKQMNLGLKGKIRIPVPIILGTKQRKLYEQAEKEMWLTIEQAAKEGDASAQKFAQAAAEGASVTQLYRLPNGAARTVRLRQILETPANLGGEDDSAVLDACVERIEDSKPQQWAVFCEFRQTTECLKQRLDKRGIVAEVYHGDVSSADRAEIKRRYQRGEVDVVIGTIKAMREGITLTAGFNQFWVSRDWTPDNNEQGEDRQNRMGQTEQVRVWIAQPKNTVATGKVAPKNKLKERIVRTILPKDEIQEVQEHELEEAN